MSVQIPVVLDVESGIKSAIARMPKALKPLQEYMDKNALEVKLRVDDKTTMTVKRILDDATLSARQLRTALEDVDAKIKARSAAGGFDLSKGLVYSEKILLQVAGALEHKINGVNDQSAIMGRIFSANIDKAKTKIAELTAKLDDLTRKQNRYNVEANRGAASQGRNAARLNRGLVAKQIANTNVELQETKALLANLSVEFDKISGGATRTAAAMTTMKTPAMMMVEEWEKGSMYLAKYNAGLTVANSRLLMLLKSTASLFALHTAFNFVRNIREVTSEFEMQRVALGGIIQDTEKANQLFARIKAAALQSPFEIKDLVTFTKQLSAYRIETDKLFDVTMRLADVSAGLGVDMNRLVLAYGQVRAAAVLRGQELRQFTEAGIPLVELLAEKFSELNGRGVTTAEVFELISKRAVPFEMIAEIFEDMTSAGGIFYQMQEKQSETLKGQWMKLKDAASIMYDEIGNTEGVHKAMEGLIQGVQKLFRNWRSSAQTLKGVIAVYAAYKLALANARVAANALTLREAASISALELNTVARSKLIASLFGEAAATKVQLKLGNAYVRMKKREMIATNLFSKSLYKMAAALLANPYAAALAGIVALTAAFIKLAKKTKTAAITYDEFERSFESFRKSSDKNKSIEELTRKYTELSSKIERTTKETEKLVHVADELGKQFPSAVTGINRETGALDLNTAAIIKNNEAAKEAIRLSFEQDKKEAESSLAALMEERDKIQAKLTSGKSGKWISSGGINPIYSYVEGALTEAEKKDLGSRLRKLGPEIDKWTKKVQEADMALRDFNGDMIGPDKPDFIGEAWRWELDQYKIKLKSVGTVARAFEKDEIRGFANQKAALEETAKRWQEQVDLIERYNKAISTATGRKKTETKKLLEDAILMRDLYWQILKDNNAIDLTVKTQNGSTWYEAIIGRGRDWVKFMKDFKGGYDKLKQYLTQGSALATEANAMFTRGAALGLSAEEQKRAAEDLVQWYKDTRDAAFSEIQRRYGDKGMFSSIEEFLGADISGNTERAKILRQFQEFLQSLFDAETDLKVSNFVANLERALHDSAEQLKRAETAQNFFDEILGLTGDRQLATKLTVQVYGEGVAKDFKERLQQGFTNALNLPGQKLSEDLRKQLSQAIGVLDIKTIREHLQELPPEMRKMFEQLLASNEAYTDDYLKNFEKTYAKAKTFDQKLKDNENQRESEILKAVKEGKGPEDIKLINEYFDQLKAGIKFGELKGNYEWSRAFEDLDGVSSQTLRRLSKMIDDYVSEYYDKLDPIQQKELTRARENIEAQLLLRDAYGGSIGVFKQLVDARRRMREEQGKGTTNSKEYKDALDDEVRALKQLSEAHQNMLSDMEKLTNSAKELVQTFASADDASYFSEQVDNSMKALSGVVMAGASLAKVFTGTATPQDYVNLVTSLSDIIVGVFDAKHAADIRRIDKEIKTQADELERLQYAYDRLGVAMEKVFGSDYIGDFQEQLDILEAQRKAYERQAELERQKGKKADEEKAKDYENSARDIADKISDMQSELAEHIAGTDLASAARDFAKAWIDAYKQFGNTADAISERFQDMIENMITESLAARIVQAQLEPIFEAIDAAAKEGGQLSIADATLIAQRTKEAVGAIDIGMTNLMNALAGAGLNVRQMGTGLTGIARDIQGASEESILGLAAGVNTQNFYMSQINNNVMQILERMKAGTAPSTVDTTVQFGDQDFRDHMDNLDKNVAAILSKLDSVITPKNASTNTHRVATT